MSAPIRRRAFALVELVISIILIVVLLSLFVPALFTVRAASQRDQCASNLRQIGQALHIYMEENDGQFPFVNHQPAWRYGGVRFATADQSPFLDSTRPLNRVVFTAGVGPANIFCCPADQGITGDLDGLGTGDRTACRSFGTSYRANAPLFDARLDGRTSQPRAMYREEISTAPSRMLVLGDAVWFEVAEQTKRDADWHEVPQTGNILFLDNSVRFQRVRPRDVTGPVMFDPVP